jgi:hypothetical protein
VNSGAPEELAVPAPLKYVDFDLIIVDYVFEMMPSQPKKSTESIYYIPIEPVYTLPGGFNRTLHISRSV